VAALYADEHVPRLVVEALRLLGHDVLTIQDDGRASAGVPDPAVLARATLLGRAVLTNNRRHFHTLHRVGPAHAGIVTYTHDPDPTALAGRIHAAVTAVADLAGRLVKVTRPNPPPGP
jgi:hypothetical protein